MLMLPECRDHRDNIATMILILVIKKIVEIKS